MPPATSTPTQDPPSQNQQPAPPKSSSFLDSLHETGYAILKDHIPPAQLQRLLSAARSLASVARSKPGAWPHLRTLPKQFPPWDPDPRHGVWGVQHLLHPDLPVSEEGRRAFQEVYFGNAVLGVVKDILGVEDEEARDGRGGAYNERAHSDGDENITNGVVSNGTQRHNDGETEGASEEATDSGDDMLVMELFNMLVTPERDFALRWHRDDVSFDLSPDEEATALGIIPPSPSIPSKSRYTANGQVKRRAYHTQYNIPLLDDTSLHIIPGSHMRPRTSHEAELLAAEPYTDALPGWIEVELRAGDIVFYDNNLIHRGVYKAGVERLTLHGSVGDVRAGGKRARNVLQHGWEWVPRCDFAGLENQRVRRRAKAMRERLVRLGSSQGDVGFAHDD